MPPTPPLIPFNIGEFVERHGWTEGAASRSSALVGLARRIGRSFFVTSQFAPAFCCVGAEVVLDATSAAANGSSHLSATGNGLEVDAAVASCLGEAADLTSQFECPGDVVARGRPTDFVNAIGHGWLAAAIERADGPIDWIRGIDARSGGEVLLPADLCIRREARRRILDPVGALSSGVAAGRDRAVATLRAVLEICERDALALWWHCGRRARSFPNGHPAAEAGHALLARLRQHGEARTTRLLDIGTDLAVPTVAAVSTDLDGFGLSCGAAARLDPAEAARAAVLELCQMELSAPLAAAKRAERGEGALNDADRRHLRRAAQPTTKLHALVPEPLAEAETGLRAPADLADLVERLHGHGIDVHLVDLTRADIGVPVMRALAPNLQPFAEGARTRRSEERRAVGESARPAMHLPLF